MPNTSLTKLTVNNNCVHIIGTTQNFTIVLIDSNNESILSYSYGNFFTKLLISHIPEYSKKEVQYYNVQEEEAFQLNTTKDFSTHQAFVHLYDSLLRIEYKNTNPKHICNVINKLIESNIGHYSIVLHSSEIIGE